VVFSAVSGASPAFLWAIHDHAVWGARAEPVDDRAGSFVARGGPAWATDDTVRVVAGIAEPDGTIRLLRCGDARIVHLN
jgi:hypothetical protein